MGAVALVVFLVWEWRDGGFASTDWLPGGLFLLGLLVTLLLAVGGAPRLSRALLVSIAFLAAFTVWNACSIAWAEVRGVAWDGTNRTLVYLVVFALFAIPAWSRRSTALLLGAFSLGVAAVGAYAFFHTTAAHPLDAFVSGRLAVPLEYPNAVACLYLSALWPALYLAARRTTPPVVRGLMLAAAGVLIDLSILCQSRGSLVALPATALVFLLVVPMRLRLITIVVPLAAAVGLGAATLIHVSQAILYQDGAVRAIDAARSTIVTTAIALFVLGAILGLVDSRVVLPRRVVRIAGATLTAVALATAAVTTIVVTAFEHPIDRVTTGWNEFKADVENNATRPHLITGFGSKRYDLWRVSLIELRRHPVGGIGSDNFAAAYLRERRTTEEPLYPHGLPFRLAAGTGVVGILLFLGWLIAALWAFVAAGGARSRDTQALACSALAVPVYWLLQGAVDWLLGDPRPRGAGLRGDGARDPHDRRRRAAPDRALVTLADRGSVRGSARPRALAHGPVALGARGARRLEHVVHRSGAGLRPARPGAAVRSAERRRGPRRRRDRAAPPGAGPGAGGVRGRWSETRRTGTRGSSWR